MFLKGVVEQHSRHGRTILLMHILRRRILETLSTSLVGWTLVNAMLAHSCLVTVEKRVPKSLIRLSVGIVYHEKEKKLATTLDQL